MQLQVPFTTHCVYMNARNVSKHQCTSITVDVTRQYCMFTICWHVIVVSILSVLFFAIHSIRDAEESTLLHHIARSKSEDTANMYTELKKNNVAVDALLEFKDLNGDTALIVACEGKGWFCVVP